jgi:hypothetical protein
LKVKLDIGRTVSTIANIGVLGGLVFVGLQLKQEAEVAQADRIVNIVDGNRYWAELLSMNSGINNAELWNKGRFGQPLSETEKVIFDALAQAWESDYWLSWFLQEEMGSALTVSASSRWAKDIALDLHEYPGLRDFWIRYQSRIAQTTEQRPWSNTVEAELSQLDEE